MLHLLIASPLQQTIRSLQADVRRFQGDLGDGEAGHIGGDQGGVAAYALPRNKALRNLNNFQPYEIPSRIVQRWRCLLQSRNLRHQIVHARAEACVQGVCNSCNLAGSDIISRFRLIVLIYLSQGSAIASLHHLRYFILQASL